MNYYKKRQKYNAKKTEYNGKLYDSKREAQHAAKLDLLIKAGEVTKYETQHIIHLEVNNKKLCKYIVDFKVYLSSGLIEYHEVKGYETDVYKLKIKLARILYPSYKFVIIK